MGLMDDLFDSNYSQRQDINALRLMAENQPDYGPQVKRLAHRLDRMELLCQTLYEFLIAKELSNEEELGILMAQIDLRDGVEDGALRQTRRDAPKCAQCGRPINPNRSQCVYCWAPIDDHSQKSEPPKRFATCGACDTEVPETETYFTDAGLRCASCFRSMQE